MTVTHHAPCGGCGRLIEMIDGHVWQHVDPLLNGHTAYPIPGHESPVSANYQGVVIATAHPVHEKPQWRLDEIRRAKEAELLREAVRVWDVTTAEIEPWGERCVLCEGDVVREGDHWRHRDRSVSCVPEPWVPVSPEPLVPAPAPSHHRWLIALAVLVVLVVLVAVLFFGLPGTFVGPVLVGASLVVRRLDIPNPRRLKA